MPSSRTGLAPHLHFRRRVLARDKAAGITNCPDCGVLMDYNISRQPNSAEPDHIIPIANGGTNDTTNGRTICRLCNQSKGARTTTNTPRKPINTSPGW